MSCRWSGQRPFGTIGFVNRSSGRNVRAFDRRYLEREHSARWAFQSKCWTRTGTHGKTDWMSFQRVILWEAFALHKTKLGPRGFHQTGHDVSAQSEYHQPASFPLTHWSLPFRALFIRRITMIDNSFNTFTAAQLSHSKSCVVAWSQRKIQCAFNTIPKINTNVRPNCSA